MYKIKKECRCCYSKNIKVIYDMGFSPIAGEYTIKPNKSQLIPLAIQGCNNCGFKQLSTVVNKTKLYKDFLYTTVSSSGLIKHFEKGASFLIKNYLKKENEYILDIGSNDGSNLNVFKKKGFKVLGVEPARNLCKISEKKGIKTICGYFNQTIAKKILKKFGKPNLICLHNTFANIDNIREFVNNLKPLCSRKTIISLESFSLYGIIKSNLFENIYHEHISYFYVENLIHFFKELGFNVIYAENNKIKGGSIKVLISQKNYINLRSIKKVLKEEKKLNLDKNNVFKKIKKTNKIKMNNIKKFLEKFNKKKIIGYGGSTSTTSLLYYYGIQNYFDLILDDDKRRNNFYSPGSNIKIQKPSKSNISQSDIIIILAWRYKKEIIKNLKKNFLKHLKKKKIFQILPSIKEIKLSKQ